MTCKVYFSHRTGRFCSRVLACDRWWAQAAPPRLSDTLCIIHSGAQPPNPQQALMPSTSGTISPQHKFIYPASLRPALPTTPHSPNIATDSTTPTNPAPAPPTIVLNTEESFTKLLFLTSWTHQALNFILAKKINPRLFWLFLLLDFWSSVCFHFVCTCARAFTKNREKTILINLYNNKNQDIKILVAAPSLFLCVRVRVR